MPNKRQTLFSAVLTRAATITVANGYGTNIGSHVKEWQTTPLESVDLPAVLVSDSTENTLVPEVGETAGLYRRELEITFDAVLAESGQNATEARKAIADIIAMIGVDQTWGGVARRTVPVSDQLMLDDTGTRIGGARVRVKIIHSRKPWAA
jgi:hypothetical protein